MNQFVVFENAGEIDPLLIVTFGVNVKENESAIGFFGTGLKYALSILTRTGCSVEIQSGSERFTFGKRTVELRGKPFEFVTMNGENLGFTTEVGKTWELWMAYRELFCNCQDEAGKVYRAEALPEPQPGVTRVVVSGAPFLEIASQHGRYFLTGVPFLSTRHVDIHHGHGQGVYYRSVRVGSISGKPSLYTYNLQHDVELTEDRTLKYAYSAGWAIAKAIVQCDDPEVISSTVTAPEDFEENGFDFDHSVEPSEAFMSVVCKLMNDRIAKVNLSALVLYRKHAKVAFAPARVRLNSVEAKQLAHALSFCELIGFSIKYPVVVVESLGTDVLGLAMDDTIYLAHRAFMIGTKTVAGTLIEEFIHLKHGYPDMTRQMQNYLFDRLVSLGELVLGEPL